MKNFNHNKMHKEKNPNWRGGKDITCLICKKLFWVKPSHINKRKCCSTECSAQLCKNTGRMAGSNNPAYGSPIIELKCNKCSKLFTILKRKSSNRKVCSKKCAASIARENRNMFGSSNPNFGNGDKIKRERNPNWKNGQTYKIKLIRKSSDYKKLIKMVKFRDGFQCIQCGACDSLEVDHIKPIAKNIELALDINNCRTLCKPCHIKTDTYGNKKENKL